MREDLSHIDQLFSNALQNAQIEAPAGVWESVSSGLTTSAAAKTTVVWFKSVWIWTAVSVLSVAAGSYFYFSPKSVQNSTNKNNKPGQVLKDVRMEKADQSNEKRLDDGSTNSKNNNTQVNEVNSAENAEESNATKLPVLENDKVDFNGEVVSEPRYQPENKAPISSKSSVESPKPCSHSISITKQEKGNGIWIFTASGVKGDCYWSIDNNVVYQTDKVMEHNFAGNEGIHIVYLKGKNMQGCDDTARDVLLMKTEMAEQTVFIPDYLTPNADGINDDLKVSVGKVSEYNLVVFDKNNKQVFMSNSPDLSWNGKAGMIDCEPGIYSVVLNYKAIGSAERKIVRKKVLLKREED